MLVISCPWCGPREETEFYHGGEAHIKRPKSPQKLTDEAWANYLFMRSNTKGIFFERWFHQNGCRQWFNAARDTTTNKIIAIYKIGKKPPLKARNDPN